IEGLKNYIRKEYYSTFPIPKTIKYVKLDKEQELLNRGIKYEAVIKKYIYPLDFFKFKNTKGLNIDFWCDPYALMEKLEKLHNGVLLDTPVMRFDPVINKDIGHEGRHRSFAYYIAGVRSMPILIMFIHFRSYVSIKKIDGRILKKFEPYEIYKK
ncbi:MAG: hypothetical protein ACP5L0_07805, partial [Caldisphaera sp.]|uniref:hypothetical protein n=1 Tax=Caldisphaera sp. TaxID=2060322 RepID=UPI003D0CA732